MKKIIPILLVLCMGIALADTISGTTSVTNVAPNISSISTNGPRDLSNGNTTVICSAVVSDANSYLDINKVNASLWNPTYANETSADNVYYHYTNASCLIGTNTSLTSSPVNCSFNVYKNAYVGTWTCKLIVTDNSNSTNSSSVNLSIYKCGDGSCTAGESCSLCPSDCGICPSGGSTSGFITTSTTENKTENLTTTAAPTAPEQQQEQKQATMITGEAISPPRKIIPLDVSLFAMAGLILVFLLIFFWPKKGFFTKRR